MSEKNRDFFTMLKPGTWIKVWTQPIGAKGLKCWHHGIVSYVNGDDVKVIHFTRSDTKSPLRVLETSIETFLENGIDPQVVDEEPSFSMEEVVERARMYLGAEDYRLPTRNCEHLASHCYKGSSFSKQVFAFGLGAGVVASVFGVLSILAIRMSKTSWV